MAKPSKGLLSSASDVMASLTSLYGSFSGYGHEVKDECEGISLALLLTTFAAIGVVFFAIYTKLTGIIGRKKRSATEDSEDAVATVLDNLNLIIHEGIDRQSPLLHTPMVGKKKGYEHKCMSILLCFWYTGSME